MIPLWIVLLTSAIPVFASSDEAEDEKINPEFCAQWNPEYSEKGFKCCSSWFDGFFLNGKRKNLNASRVCSPARRKSIFRNEMDPTQVNYIENVKSGNLDVQSYLALTSGSVGRQAFCKNGNGFLAKGVPLLPLPSAEDPSINRVELRNSERYTNFGTHQTVQALDWLGRQIAKEYPEDSFKKLRLIVGDISAPKGGCISGRRNQAAHRSHRRGTDADVRFFNATPTVGGQQIDPRFTKEFNYASNWWFLKKVFNNPTACVQKVILDKKITRKLEKFVTKYYPQDVGFWKKIVRYIPHFRGHSNHYHISFEDHPGEPGCGIAANSKDADFEENFEGEEAGEGAENRSVASEEEETADEELGSSKVVEAQGSAADMATSGIVGVTPFHKMEPSISREFERKEFPSGRSSRKSRRSKKT